MSNECTTIAWKRKFGSKARKTVAIRLADHADEDGCGIWPSVERVAAQCELSARTVQRALKDFVAEGLLIVVIEGGHGRHSATRYDFDMARLKALPEVVWGEKRTVEIDEIFDEIDETKGDTMSPLEGFKGDIGDAKGDIGDAKGDIGDAKGDMVSPKPSYNHHITTIEPSVARDALLIDEIPPPEKSLVTNKRGCRLLPDWQPDGADIEFARKEGMSHDEIERTADRFRDYWCGLAGQKAVKRDWHATWRNWIRSDLDRRKAPNAARRGPSQKLFMGFARSAAKNERGA